MAPRPNPPPLDAASPLNSTPAAHAAAASPHSHQLISSLLSLRGVALCPRSSKQKTTSRNQQPCGLQQRACARCATNAPTPAAAAAAAAAFPTAAHRLAPD
eukprot:9331836-Pyramimonas_sp.AAC.1